MAALAIEASARGMSDKKRATGHTAQYQTLARALGYAAGLMEDDLEELADVGLDERAARLRMEARFVTITLLAAAMAECLANTVLALASDGTHPALKDKRSRPLKRWMDEIPHALGCAPFLTEGLKRDLELLIDVRNAITHANPELFTSENEIVATGNAERWSKLTRENVRMFVGLPLRLIAVVPQGDHLHWPIEFLANDHWLAIAIARGRGEPGRSYNMWRPENRAARLKRRREEGLR